MYSRELYHDGRSHKYIAKVKTADGRFRYFYDQAEYDAYMKVKKQEDAKKEEARKQDYKTQRDRASQQKYREYAKRTGNYSVPKKKLETKTYRQSVRERYESGKPVKAYEVKQIRRTNKINATRKAVLDNSREWRQKAARTGKAFIDNILQPDK